MALRNFVKDVPSLSSPVFRSTQHPSIQGGVRRLHTSSPRRLSRMKEKDSGNATGVMSVDRLHKGKLVASNPAFRIRV